MENTHLGDKSPGILVWLPSQVTWQNEGIELNEILSLFCSLCTEKIVTSERELPFVIVHLLWTFPLWQDYSPLSLCPARYTLLCSDRPLPSPETILGAIFIASFQGYVTWSLLCVLVVLSDSWEIKTIVIFYMYIQKPQQWCIDLEKVVFFLREGIKQYCCISSSMFSEPLKEQRACYLKGYDIQREKNIVRVQ